MDVLITFLASFLTWIIIAGLIYLWIIDGRVKKEQVVHALFAAFFSWTASEILKTIFATPRPFHLTDVKPLTIMTPGGYAFPSSHTALVFAIALTIWLHDKKIGLLFMTSAVLVGIARIFAQVHFLQDIVGGAVVGIVIALIIEKVHFPFRKP